MSDKSEAKDVKVEKRARQASTSTVDSQDITQELENLISENELDQNFPEDILVRAHHVLHSEQEGVVDVEAAQTLLDEVKEHKELVKNNSAYVEVRAVVDPTDDPTLPVATFRVWFMGTVFCILGSGIQQFFSLRLPSITVSTYVVQIASMPLGALMAKVLPERKFGRDRWWAFSFNPGPFNQKEHLLIAIMANVSYGGHSTGAYINSIVQVLKLDRFFGEKLLSNNIPWQICALLATQLLGYGCAGMTRRFLVYPPAMIWQRALANMALTKALHKDHGQDAQHAVNGWTMSRYRFFIICFCAMFAYYWIPNYFFEGLALFNWPTWISPTNVNLAIIAGSTCGLGLNPLPTLDWNIATYLGDPIVTPLFTLLNFAAGMAIAGFVITPLLYFHNAWNGAHLPINTNRLFDNTGRHYDIHRIMHANMTINEAAYLEYSMPWLSTTQVLNYVGCFTMYASVPVHIALYFRKEIAKGVLALWCGESREKQFPDVQNRLMRAYREVPHWWYLTVLAGSFGLACFAVTFWPTDMPIWAIFLALSFTLVLQIPVGMLMAITNTDIPTGILAMCVGGYALEGRAIPNMIFKMFSYMSTCQSLNFVADMKLAHYAKIPPRAAFVAQVYATVIAGFVCLGVNHWVLDHVPDICTDSQADRFTCPHTYSFFKSSVLWGVVGPRRLFGPGAPYNILLWCIPIGIVLPILVFLGLKQWPTSWLRSVNIPVFLAGPFGWAPFNWAYMQGSVVLAIFFNYFIKRRYRQWWERYAYVLSGSFVAAIGLAGLFMFFTLQKWGFRLEWWGNEVFRQGVDRAGAKSANGKSIQCVYQPLRKGQSFGTGFV